MEKTENMVDSIQSELYKVKGAVEDFHTAIYGLSGKINSTRKFVGGFFERFSFQGLIQAVVSLFSRNKKRKEEKYAAYDDNDFDI